MRTFVAMCNNVMAGSAAITTEPAEIRGGPALLERTDRDNAEAPRDLSGTMCMESDQTTAAPPGKVPQARRQLRPTGYKKPDPKK